MKLESKLVLASRNAVTGVPLYTFVLTYPRVILAEVNTHRTLSRNTASSRAIPSKKQRQRVLDDPFLPMSIGQNQKGMQAGKELSGWRRSLAYRIWSAARYPMVFANWALDKLGAHKQVTNRLVEPWTYTQQIVTATDLKNVFKLRNHDAAEPHFHALAAQMQEQVEYAERTFNLLGWSGDSFVNRRLEINNKLGIGVLQALNPGEWHMPFINLQDLRYKDGFSFSGAPFDWEMMKQVSAARCARVSYFLPENGQVSTVERDIELCTRLSTSGHWSPFEHVATPVNEDEYLGNFRSWKQYRKEFSEEKGGD